MHVNHGEGSRRVKGSSPSSRGARIGRPCTSMRMHGRSHNSATTPRSAAVVVSSPSSFSPYREARITIWIFMVLAPAQLRRPNYGRGRRLCQGGREEPAIQATRQPPSDSYACHTAHGSRRQERRSKCVPFAPCRRGINLECSLWRMPRLSVCLHLSLSFCPSCQPNHCYRQSDRELRIWNDLSHFHVASHVGGGKRGSGGKCPKSMI